MRNCVKIFFFFWAFFLFSHLLFYPMIPLTYGSPACFTHNVMAPLWVENWSEFENQLETVKSIGVTAVSVDVWWGVVEKDNDQVFNWNYYDTIFAMIKAKGLKIIPIMSFHQCGGNPGDNYSFKIPAWIWSKYVGRVINGVILDNNDLKYKSETGKFIDETVSLWGDEIAKEQYIEFMDAFEQHFADYANDFLEINISCGPAGELRYPSYNKTIDLWSYPHRGYLQAYSKLAVKGFQDHIINKYGTFAGVNAAWGTNLSGINKIIPPGGNQNDRDFFYNNKEYFNTQYGRDLTDWYNGALVEHGRIIIKSAHQAFDEQMSDIAIGVKIPGVHWLTKETANYPAYRAAEMTAGLIGSDISENNGKGYKPIVSMLKSIENQLGRNIILHFTCLEMANYSQGSHSLTEDLVKWVGYAAAREDLTLKGENALAGAEHGFDNYWQYIRQALSLEYNENPVYSGITILRINNVIAGQAKSHYETLIRNFEACWQQVYFRGTPNNFDTSLPMDNIESGIWQVTVSFSNSPNERFKFDIYGDWSQNYGDNESDGFIDRSGEDIHITQGSGNYTIILNENTKEYSIIPEQVIVGSAKIRYTIPDQDGDQLAGLSVNLEKNNLLINTENINIDQTGTAVSLHSNLEQGNYIIRLNKVKNNFRYKGLTSISIDSTNQVNAIMQVQVTKTDPNDYEYIYEHVYFRGTSNDWETTEMDLVADYTWELIVPFVGETNERFKFDILGDWSLNFGDNNQDGIADQDGEDIYITEGEGEYTIKFTDNTKEYSIEKKSTGNPLFKFFKAIWYKLFR